MASKPRAKGATTAPPTTSGRRAAAGGSSSGGSPSGSATVRDEDVPVVGQREPCPCGSGKRYKSCHGRARRVEATELVLRPFEGLPGECDLVAMREIVPAATARARTKAAHGGEPVVIATVLPLAAPALRRSDGQLFAGLQTMGTSGDPNRDTAAALLRAVEAEPGTTIPGGTLPGPGPRLGDVLDIDSPLLVEVHQGFDFWLEGTEDITPQVRESLERANSAVVPTARLESVEAAYWCQMGERRHLRWVLPHAEDQLLDGLARLHAAQATPVVPASRYIGAFRVHGLMVPVWDLPTDLTAEDLEGPAKAFAERLADAVSRTEPLTPEERRARAGVVSRQLTLR